MTKASGGWRKVQGSKYVHLNGGRGGHANPPLKALGINWPYMALYAPRVAV